MMNLLQYDLPAVRLCKLGIPALSVSQKPDQVIFLPAGFHSIPCLHGI